MSLGMFKFSVMELLVIQLNFRTSYFSVRKKINSVKCQRYFLRFTLLTRRGKYVTALFFKNSLMK